MAKYSFEFKKKVVMEYLNGEVGIKSLSSKYNIPASSNVERWINNYKAFGEDGLKRSRRQEKYSFEFKLHVVELYLTSEVSYQELSIQEGINNPSLLCEWVNRFQIAGPDALRSHKKGWKKTLENDNSKNSNQSAEISEIDSSAEHVKELEDELLKLRVENTFLKELRRLHLEDEARMRDLQESSPASEDNSN